jgi:hypothetical protein
MAVYLLEGPHLLYMGSVYGVFASWESLVEYCESGKGAAIGVVSERLLSPADRETGRMHAALLECLYILPESL